MSAPRLTVCLPVLNGDNFIEEALVSILGQTFGDFLLVVSDQASTDGTPDILDRYARMDKRLIVDRTEEPHTIATNMARSLELSQGRWVKMFCHDDTMRPDCLEKINAVLDRNDDSNLGLIGIATRHEFLNGYVTPDVVDKPPEYIDGRTVIRQYLGGTQHYSMPGVTETTIRKEAWERAGGFASRFLHFDILCWLRVLARYDYVTMPETLATIRVHPGQVTHFARKSLSWMNEYREFIPQFLDEYADVLKLNRKTEMRARMIPVNIAAKSLVAELRTSRWGSASTMLRHIPVSWLPLLPPLMARSWLMQRRQLREGLKHVPLELLAVSA